MSKQAYRQEQLVQVGVTDAHSLALSNAAAVDLALIHHLSSFLLSFPFFFYWAAATHSNETIWNVEEFLRPHYET